MNAGSQFRRVQHLVNVSGGKDSTATYLLGLESGRDFRAVFADTGNEHELTYEFVRRLPERTGGPAIEWVKADFRARMAKHKAYVLERWPQMGIPMHSSARLRNCTSPQATPSSTSASPKGAFRRGWLSFVPPS